MRYNKYTEKNRCSMAEGRCPFCKLTTLSTENRDLFGQTFRKHGLTVHQYCLVLYIIPTYDISYNLLAYLRSFRCKLCILQYFAAGLLQRGQDNEGIYGFLLADIRKEVARAKKLVSCLVMFPDMNRWCPEHPDM